MNIEWHFNRPWASPSFEISDEYRKRLVESVGRVIEREFADEPTDTTLAGILHADQRAQEGIDAATPIVAYLRMLTTNGVSQERAERMAETWAFARLTDDAEQSGMYLTIGDMVTLDEEPKG